MFKVGDKVVCTDAKGQKRLKLGAVYTVDKLDGHKVFVKGYARFSFLAERFKYAKS